MSQCNLFFIDSKEFAAPMINDPLKCAILPVQIEGGTEAYFVTGAQGTTLAPALRAPVARSR